MIKHLRATATLFVMVIITLLFCSTLFLLWPLSLLPIPAWKRFLHRSFHAFPDHWARVIMAFLNTVLPIQWQVEGLENFNQNEWYLMLCNHTTWTDILVLQRTFLGRIPSLRFFMKRELLWQLPVAGQACYILGYPFVKRYSRQFLEKHPEYKGRDIAATRKALKQFEHHPITIINFSEGHRFSFKRRAKEQSPYQLLLKPRAGGVAFAMAAMQGHLKHFINVTLLYPSHDLSFWDFLAGKVTQITVKVEKITIPPDLWGDYENVPEFRAKMQHWLNELWHEKDKILIRHYLPEKKTVVYDKELI